jgi:hypothetical protein
MPLDFYNARNANDRWEDAQDAVEIAQASLTAAIRRSIRAQQKENEAQAVLHQVRIAERLAFAEVQRAETTTIDGSVLAEMA